MTIRRNYPALGLKEKFMLEAEAASFCEGFDVPDEGNIDIVALARSKGFRVQRLDMDKKCAAMTICNEVEKVIAVSSSFDKQHSRWLIARELARCVFNKDKVRFAHTEELHLNATVEDVKVDYFANILLIPREKAEKMYNEISALGNTINIGEALTPYAEKFGTPLALTAARYYSIMTLRNSLTPKGPESDLPDDISDGFTVKER